VNLLLSCIGKRGYIADYFRTHLRPGEKIIGTSHTRWTPGFGACDLGLLMPPLDSDEYVPTLIEACTRYDVGGLLSFFDPDVAVLSHHLDALKAAGIVPVMPREQVVWAAWDKWRTFEVLSQAGVQVPSTFIDLAPVHAGLSDGSLRFPLIVKPRRGFGAADVFIARNRMQLDAFFGYAPGMLIQTFIDGDSYDIEALADLDGRVLHVVAWQRLRSRAGETEHALTVEAPDLIELGQRLAECVGLVGPMDVDLIRGPGGGVWVIEINLRFGGGYPVSHLAGADFPGLIVEMLRGTHPEPRIGVYRRGVCMLKGLQVMGGSETTFLEELRSANR
jgi:carbamoyl-phosphate synthase large subunit